MKKSLNINELTLEQKIGQLLCVRGFLDEEDRAYVYEMIRNKSVGAVQVAYYDGCEKEIAEIREELEQGGYVKIKRGNKQKKEKPLPPIEFRSSDGFKILVGRNNIQNDMITTKIAKKGDLWFHTKDIPGSHVIMVTEGEDPSEQDYTEAAEAAAHFSKATGDLVAVDYTAVKNVKKPQGAKPGFVIYKTNYTAFVKPKAPEGN